MLEMIVLRKSVDASMAVQVLSIVSSMSLLRFLAFNALFYIFQVFAGFYVGSAKEKQQS